MMMIAADCVQESVRGAPPPDKKLLEYHFVFACIWAFGGCMLVDKVYDYRTQFSKWWISEWKVRAFEGDRDIACTIIAHTLSSE